MKMTERSVRQAFATNVSYPTFTQEADGAFIHVRADWNTAEFDVISDDSPIDTAYMLTSVRILSNRIPGVHLSAQVEGGKRSEVLPKVQALLEQLEK